MDCAGGVVESPQLHSVWRGMPRNDWVICGSLDGYLRGEMLTVVGICCAVGSGI